MNLANTRIGVRLGVSFAILIAMMVLAIGVAIVRFSSLQAANSSLIDKIHSRIDALSLAATSRDARVSRVPRVFHAPRLGGALQPRCKLMTYFIWAKAGRSSAASSTN